MSKQETPSALVRAECRDDIALLTLDRPKALNALSRELSRQFVACLDDLAKRTDCKVLVITGAGRAFCAGLDLKEVESGGLDAVAGADVPDPAAAIESFPVPVIAAVNGAAITGGFELVLASDIILAGEAALFADTHAKVGVVPGWGLSQRLSRLVGLYRAKELSLTGRFVNAREAYEWGIVNRVVPDDELINAAMTMARSILANAPGVTEAIGSLIDEGFDLALGDALELEALRSKAWNENLTAAALEGRRGAVSAAGRAHVRGR